ncbi:hypothetical protein V496_05241 [Pseudogymnoascus sp. VKM F-4515 (FW-2607)]|nr:hypothetical protein V496_05241 [Pseudogymnoascus sp. VKM F-4515 (FW-2607)]
MGRKGRYGSKEKLHSVRRAGVCKPRLHRPGWTGGGGGGAARGFWTLTLPMDGWFGRIWDMQDIFDVRLPLRHGTRPSLIGNQKRLDGLPSLPS